MSGWNPPPPPGGGGMPPGGYGTPPPPPGGYGTPPPPGGYGTPPPPGGGGYGTPPPPGGYGPPPGPGGPYGQPGQPFGAPPPRPKSNAGLIIGLIAGAVVLVVVVVGALVVIGSGGKEYTINPPTTVLGHTRDLSTESQISNRMAPLETQMRTAARGKIDKFVTAFYKKNTGGTSGSTLMPNGVVFVGGTGDLGDPDKFIEEFKSAGGRQGSTVVDVEPGSHGGKAACGTVSAAGVSVTQCAWATSSTFGVIVPMGSSETTSTAASTMRLFRSSVEQEK